MSSILEALKKAEQEDPVHGVTPDLKLGAHRLLSTPNLNKPLKKTKVPKKLVAGGVAALFICIGGLLYLRNDKPEPEPMSDPNPKPVVKAKKPRISNVVSQTVAEPMPVPEKGRQIPLPPPAPAAPPKQKEPIAAKAFQPPPEPQAPPAVKPPPLPLKKDTVIESREPIQKNEPAQIKESHTIKENYPDLEDASILIQAISWHNEPDNRVAVINNRVLNENESIEGYRIIEIRKDAVLLEKEGNRFKKNFNYR